jgi:S1-C subfamily serine protease
MLPLTLTLLAAAPAAPVPRPRPPDPTGYAYVGVRMNTSPAQNPRLRIDTPEPGTPAAAAGLKEGDEIIRIGQARPTTFYEFADYVLDLRPGTKVLVELQRGDRTEFVWLTLGVRPPPPDYPDPDFSRKVPGGAK